MSDSADGAIEAQWESGIWNRYRLDAVTYSDRLKRQGGKCAICGTDKPGGKSNRMQVDHCHVTGEIRGLLCANCNTGLGMLGDTREAVLRALWYLRPTSKQRVAVHVVRFSQCKWLRLQWRCPLTGLKKTRSAKTACRGRAKEHAAKLEELLNGREKAKESIEAFAWV
jgi:hypothetical protein